MAGGLEGQKRLTIIVPFLKRQGDPNDHSGRSARRISRMA
jgi:hypothetical protein